MNNFNQFGDILVIFLFIIKYLSNILVYVLSETQNMSNIQVVLLFVKLTSTISECELFPFVCNM